MELSDATPVTQKPLSDSVKVTGQNKLLLPCPFCGELPWVGPVNPEFEGTCVGYVVCSYDQCPARPMVSHDILVNDERGTAAYQANAIDRWNQRAKQAPPSEDTKRLENALGITLLDAKWLDPECWQGCQSLRFKYALRDALEELRNIVNADLDGMRKDFGDGGANLQFRLWAQNRARAFLEKVEKRDDAGSGLNALPQGTPRELPKEGESAAPPSATTKDKSKEQSFEE